MILRAPAKINLALDILGKHRSGYHEIQTVMQEVPDLYDEVEISESYGNEESAKSEWQTYPSGTHPVLKLLAKASGTSLSKLNFRIKVSQKIPRGSGLGGESSVSAAILKGVNKLAKLHLTIKDLENLGAQIGMDVPFFIRGGAALATHFGEKITPLKPFDIEIILYPVATAAFNKSRDAYAALDLSKCGQQTQKTEKLLKSKDPTPFIHNDFETLIAVKPGFHLTGSGPSTFKILSSPSAPATK